MSDIPLPPKHKNTLSKRKKKKAWRQYQKDLVEYGSEIPNGELVRFMNELCKSRGFSSNQMNMTSVVSTLTGRIFRTKLAAKSWLIRQYYEQKTGVVSLPPAPVLSSDVSDFYKSEAWRQLRYRALLKSNGCCQACGNGPSPGKPLHVDHIKPRSKYPDLALDPENLQVLCDDCNLGKGVWDETDWRS